MIFIMNDKFCIKNNNYFIYIKIYKTLLININYIIEQN